MHCEVSDSGKMVIEAKDLAKSFPFEGRCFDVLHNINLKVCAGQSLSIRGDSGCGKTTLLNLLARLETGDRGEISWGTHKMNAASKCESYEASMRASFLGVVYQAYYLIPELNVIENVLIASRLSGCCGRQSRDRARELLSRMGVGSKERQVPSKLSGGERQRVAIARALINKPKLILADEPTGNLDERTGGEVMDLLLKTCAEENASLILVTHNPSFAESTDHSLFLRKGNLEVQ